jgi:hypothetical protein
MSQCHVAVDVQGLVDQCRAASISYDAVAVLCELAEEYAQQCALAGLCLAWRRTTDMAALCPPPQCEADDPESHFEECGPGCEATCSDMASAANCWRPRGPGCYCNPDRVK